MERSIQRRVKDARELCDEYKKLDRYDRLMTWEKGKILHQLKKSRDFKFVYGTHTDNVEKSWSAFVKEELDEPLSTANYRVDLYEKWVVQLRKKPEDICDINTRKLHRAIPFVTEDNADELVEHARSIIGFEDFCEWLNENYTRNS